MRDAEADVRSSRGGRWQMWSDGGRCVREGVMEAMRERQRGSDGGVSVREMEA